MELVRSGYDETCRGIRADRRMSGYAGLRLQEMQKMLPQGRLRIRGEVRRGLSFAAPSTARLGALANARILATYV